MNVFSVERVSPSRLEHGGPQRMKCFPSRCECVLGFVHENKAFFSDQKRLYSERSTFFVRPLRTIQVENLSPLQRGAAGTATLFLGNQSYFALVRAHHLSPSALHCCQTALSFKTTFSQLYNVGRQLRLCAGTPQICITPKISCLVGIFSGCLRQCKAPNLQNKVYT